MLHKIDYLSFTYFSQAVADATNYQIWEEFEKSIPAHIELPPTWTNAPKRRGFDGGLNINNHTFCFYSHQGLCLIEHTGQGCDLLAQRGLLLDVVKAQSALLTRLDIASDLLSDARPKAFVLLRGGERIKAEGFVFSSTGETCYVGSKNSDRCCKVYRYDGSHPRKNLLRIEYTYRRQQAKLIGELLKTVSLDDVAMRSSVRYGWRHEAWTSATTGDYETIKAYRPERRSGKTVNWIYSQCIPAIARLVKDGTLDVSEVINEILKASS